ncbi:MAG: AmmeMemoRadiSam system protein B [Promethearchaeota archaeon]
MTLTRKPAVAGTFYPRFEKDIVNLIDKSFLDEKFGIGKKFVIENKKDGKRKVLGGISPHAGYVYSAPCAIHTIQEIFREGAPDTIIILGTQHTGYDKIGLMKAGMWKTPLGDLEIDSAVSSELLKESSNIIEDDSAFFGFPHHREHNIEVQLPLIQYAAKNAKKEIKIVPIKVGRMEKNVLQELGKAIANVIKKNQNKDIAIIASSDMTHYQPRDPHNPDTEIKSIQKNRDQAVIDAFEEFNWEKTLTKANETSVCGPQTITTLMIAAKELGYKSAKELKYYTSYEKMGSRTPCDYSVGYFSGIILKD